MQAVTAQPQEVLPETDLQMKEPSKTAGPATIVTVTGTGTSRGGIVSRGTTTITNSYFDTDVYEATGTNGKTTTELQSPTGYTGIYATWDDDNLDGIDGADSPLGLRY